MVDIGRGITFTQGYGLTETSPVVAFLAPADGRRKLELEELREFAGRELARFKLRSGCTR